MVRIFSILLFCVFSISDSFGQLAVKKLSSLVNSKDFDEVCPILSHNENQLYFTRIGSEDFVHTLIEDNVDVSKLPNFKSRLQSIYSDIAGRHIARPVESTFNQDIWVADFDKGEVTAVNHPPYPLNSALPNSMCSTYGGKNMYVVLNEYGKEGGMQLGFSTVRHLGNRKYSHPEPLHIEGFEVHGGEVNFTVTNDMYYVIIAMEGPDSYGGKDLYYSIKTFGNNYSKPINMGPVINTPYDESAPKFSSNNTRLYFASDRPEGFGKKDIYMSVRLDFSLDSWSEPELLPSPINTIYNDSYPIVMQNGRSIIFSSDRDGSSDIYYSYHAHVEELTHAVRVVVVEERDGKLRNVGAEIFWAKNGLYDGYFRSSSGMMDYVFENDQSVEFKAKSRSKSSEVVMVDPKELLDKGINEVIITLRPQGATVSGQNLDHVVSKKSDTRKKEPAQIESRRKKYTDSELQRLHNELSRKGQVTLNNIYFERSKPIVLTSSYRALNKLASVLKDNPTTEIVIEGHTDNVGDEQALLELSEARASSIKKYLMQKGVNAKQLRVMGYGGTKPITKNRNELERKRNRRVEIKVSKQPEKNMGS